MGVKYRFRDGARVPAALKAEKVEEALTQIHDEHGRVTAEIVVEASRPKNAPLHPAFEWRDKVAAERYRKHQASTLIRNVTVIIDKHVSPTWTYVPGMVPEADAGDGNGSVERGAYHPTEAVVQHVDEFALALDALNDRLIAAQRAVEALERVARRHGGEESDRLALIIVASKALVTAGDALRGIH